MSCFQSGCADGPFHQHPGRRPREPHHLRFTELRRLVSAAGWTERPMPRGLVSIPPADEGSRAPVTCSHGCFLFCSLSMPTLVLGGLCFP